MEFLNSFISVTPILWFFATLLFLCHFISNWIKTRNYPPGPPGLPLVGYVPLLGKLPSDTIWKLGKKYGDIFSFYVGPRLVICVNDKQMMKKLLSNPLTLARPKGAADFIAGKGGKRNCPGESVAMMSMYLYFVSIMQKFTIKTPNGGQPDMEYKYCGAVCIPNSQELCFIER